MNLNDDKNPSNGTILKFNITENMFKAGVAEFTLKSYDFEIMLTNNRKCCVPFSSKDLSISKNSKNIEKKLWQELDDTVTQNPKVFGPAIADIENQLIQHRDKIFSINKTNNKDKITVDPPRAKFSEEAKILKRQYKEQGLTYNQWQTKVAEKYDNLKKVTFKHYPEAWTFLEFSLSVKSILNIEDFTLPFMGVILAAPASMKTMIIQLFRKYSGSFYTDSFTPNSLVSHNSALTEEQLQQVDMLPKMKDKLVLTPELAPIFTAKDDDLQKVLGMITRISDGHGFENDSGAQGHRRYGETMFVWLGAAVEIPPKVWKLLGTLGHRIYFLRPQLHKKSPEDLKRIAKGNNFLANNKEIEEALLDYLKTFDAAPETENKIKVDQNGLVKIKWDDKVEEEQDEAIGYIAQVANLLAPLRGTVYLSESNSAVYRKKYLSESNSHNSNTSSILIQVEGKDYDSDFPIIEDASRAMILLRNIAIGHAASQGRDSINLRDVPIAIKVALSTAPVRRVKGLDLLLKKGGEVTTSQITEELRVSQPIARCTMREFHALGIADLSTITEYANAELKITLNSEYDWFKTKDFERLREGFVSSGNSRGENNIETTTTQGEQPCDIIPCHMQKAKLPTETHKNNYEYELIQQHEQNNNVKLSDTTSTEKNNVSLRGENNFHHVTQLHGHMQLESDNVSKDTEAILEQILTIIREAKGSTLSINSAIESAYRGDPNVSACLGDKLTSRENRKVRELCLKVIRHDNIEVVKHRPQLLVKWSNIGKTVTQ